MVIVSSEALDVIKMRIASHKVWGVRILTKPLVVMAGSGI